ncbi:serine/threonine-protein phosphatase 7 long form [Dorcoceras hygrometricum]|uniref:Serine/threonine-protein phosphatase 7 long form n=1 Tax=Dorcoceras hygrometricum TaxID=472368 RepID=A0A2Z7D3Z4_9LAMI|nr:serine/threonine-protein phosphatase 7 long form [Dorcoceras hygrometricum]
MEKKKVRCYNKRMPAGADANRGPEDPIVLYLQATHISSAISIDTIDHIIHVNRSDNLIWMLYSGENIHNRIWAWSRIKLVNPDRDNLALVAPNIQPDGHTPIPLYDAQIGHRNTDLKSYHRDAIRLWNRKFRLVVDDEEHGCSRQIDDDYMSWFERVTVRVISPTIHGVGYRPLLYDHLVAGQHSMRQDLNFSTPSLDSHQSSAGPSGYGDQYDLFASHQSSAGPSGNVDLYDVFVSHRSSAGPSGNVDLYDVFASHRSSAGPSIGQHLTPEHDTLQSFVDKGYQTPIWSNVQSFTDLLNVNLQQNVHDHTERYIVTPILFPSYSGEQNIATN